eukprot:TRINITY_DN275_c0_g1_i2.p1 TRINITY_DN275_c0_g1~~TRINITY_DN275_c0_g1_i2.p1  ORF type:complete len:1096 (+),score=388.85 TRINITY_DN275_c0_g1_i2:41-3328(+)
MSFTRVGTVLAVASMVGCQCTGMGGPWYDSATEDVMTVSEAGCVLSSKYGKVRVTGKKVSPEGGLLAAIGVEGQWDSFGSRIKWSNGVTWTKKVGTEELLTELRDLKDKHSDAMGRIDALETTVTRLSSCCNSTSPGTPTSPADVDALKQSLDDLSERVDLLNKSRTGPAGRDGYCMTTPNTTEVYVPKQVFVHNRYTPTSTCTGETVNDDGCRWSFHMEKVLNIRVGDTLVFWRHDSKVHDLWEFQTEAAFDGCDFSKATLRVGSTEFASFEDTRNYTMTFTAAGDHFFGAKFPDSMVTNEVKKRELCWDPTDPPTGAVAGQMLGFGEGSKITIRVLDPTKEEMVTCPLYDPSKYGVKDGKAADSESVEKLKGTVAALGRQLILAEARTAERVREQGQSGLTLTRSVEQGSDAYYEPSYGSMGAANIHNHANTHHTIGLGEFGAVLNGVQFTTRHNDYSLVQPDPTLSPDDYKSEWPPKASAIEGPEVPPAVLGAGTVPEQVAEMREWFKAFHTQNKTHRNYPDYFKPVLCYLEGTWAEPAEEVAEPFNSERHHIDADSWMDLHEKLNFMFNNGQKHILENLAFLPTAIRGIREGTVFEPREAQWFYRISCRPVKNDIPTERFRVKNDLHVQMKQYKPATRKELGSTPHALFEMNPKLQADWAPGAKWKRGATTMEYVDELMSDIPGFDGPQASLMTDESFGVLCETLNGTTTLDTARYTRHFSLGHIDAMGRTAKRRGFNDYLFAAQTTHPKVSPLTTCGNPDFDGRNTVAPDPVDTARQAECQKITTREGCTTTWEAAEVKAAEGAKCSWAGAKVGCIYKKCWTQRWSYAIPLEVVYLTPLLKWNPYNIEYHEKKTPGYDAVKKMTTNTGLSPGTPFKGSRQDLFFRTPAELFKDQLHPDPADSSGGETFVEDKNGVVRKTRASGTWVFTPEIEGVGAVRTRYPVFPVHEHGNTVWKEAKAVADLVMMKDTNADVREVINEARGGGFGVELRLGGGGHDHYIKIEPEELEQARAGTKTEFLKISDTRNAHAHTVMVVYDRTAKKWNLKACNQNNNFVPCPASVIASGGCASSPVNCCAGKCPDGHFYLAPPF